jgi:bifunctional ADP-heptose synthase (sugar kinase/adenylyltransferase)
MKKILLIGEICIDEYIYGYCDRVCPEASALCFLDSGIIKENFGMSGNVYNNLKAIDPTLNINHIKPEIKIIKRRFIDTKYNTIIFRQDINDKCNRIDINKYDFSIYDYIIISDYCKGFLTEEDIKYIANHKKHNSTIFIDTKKKLVSQMLEGIDFIKINNKEYQDNIYDIDTIRKKSSIIVTNGEHGATLYEKSSTTIEHFPTDIVFLRDVCGAGDTFLASLVVKYIETSNIKESIRFANVCSAKVVSKFGVTTI